MKGANDRELNDIQAQIFQGSEVFVVFAEFGGEWIKTANKWLCSFVKIRKQKVSISITKMKRASERLTCSKRQAWRKSPSAIFKPQTPSSFKPTPEVSRAVTLNIANTLCQGIVEHIFEAIDQVETFKFIREIQENSKHIYKFVLDAVEPRIETNHQSINCPEDQPTPSASDFICSGEKPVERKPIKREFACISAFNTPLKELRQKEKGCTSSKELLCPKRSIRTGLVPLPSVDCEEDVRSTLLQTFYRDKFAREDSINQQENHPKQELARMFRKTNTRDKEQFAFDYDGEKIPIVCSNNLKNNPLKVLKTVYKVHKDRSQLRHLKKSHESIRFSKLPEPNTSNRFMQSGTDLYQLKKGIQQNIKWAGKLHSIRLISQNQEAK